MNRSFRLGGSWLLCTFCVAALAQTTPIPTEIARRYFAEAQSLCQRDNGHLWGTSLCGPMMFVDPKSRYLLANQADNEGLLQRENGVFAGSLPSDQTIANTAVEWAGVRWTQILWPLPQDENQRETLMAHELFHRIQPRLGLPVSKEGTNAHLDTVDGRYYLQLEWRALAGALSASSDQARRMAAADALLFRAERYRRFPDAAAQERPLELNEGLAEYTGVRIGNPTSDGEIQGALHDLSTHKNDSTFVRSFAYATGPAYGLLLDRYDPTWHQQLKTGAGLDGLLASALAITPPSNLESAANRQAALYDGPTLRASELEREVKRQKVIALYRQKFVDGPVLTLPLRHMRVQFNPTTLQPLDEAGTVYPTMHVTDDWGVLDATNGALMRPDWTAAMVAVPRSTTGTHLEGDGWTLDLKPGWKIIPGNRKGDFTLEQGS